MAWQQIVVVVLLIVAIAAALFFAIRAELRRLKRIRAWAAKRGWSYEKVDKRLEREYRSFKPFAIGSGRRCRHVMGGEHGGRAATVFQYQYTVQHGKNSQTHYHTVCDMEMPLDGPDLVIDKETLGHKIFDALGGEAIDFESDAFSRRFWVRCRDRRFAYDVIHPAMMEWLENQPSRLWQWRGYRMVISTSGRLKLETVQQLLDAAAAFRDHVPRHLLGDP